MPTHRLSLALVLVLLGGSAWAAAPANKLSPSDRKFIHEAAQGGMLEVQLGNLVAQQASDPEVKAFAQRMVADHGRANQELQTIASRLSVNLPQRLDRRSQGIYDKLKKLSGMAFDRAYMTSMVRDHTRDVKAFEEQSKSATNADVRHFAETTLPVLYEHLRMAKDLDMKLMTGVGGSGLPHGPPPPTPAPEK